jgi:5-methylcytosine-specific restriction protein A
MLMPPHRCARCARVVTGACPHCVKTRDQARPTAQQRGYTSARWRRFRAVQLETHPLCAWCLAAGRTMQADCVDHITPVTGPDDPTFLRFECVQSLCSSCHSLKTAKFDSRFLTHQQVDTQ